MKNTAPALKSRIVFNRQSVQAALRSLQSKLRSINQLPPNGLVLFSGNCADKDSGREKKICLALEPLLPVTIQAYKCDSRFHTEYLGEQFDDQKSFGFVILYDQTFLCFCFFLTQSYFV
jgi:peptide subunit release factor 1 (eRF1)